MALIGFLFTVFCLHRVDVFAADFTTTGSKMLLYNLLRVVFLFYYTWLLAGAGSLLLTAFRRRGVALGLAWEEGLLLNFFTGAAIVTIVMLPLGLFSLYYPVTALALSVPVLIATYPKLVRQLHELGKAFQRVFRPAGGWTLEKAAEVFLVVAGLFLVLVLLLTRCLYPGETGNDCYEIYWPYQRMVIATHSLLPNDVWYMFFSFNGAGINYLPMLLSDDMACQSTSFLMLLATIAAVYCMVKRIGGSKLWALLAAVTSLACFPFSNTEGWGAFQSHHIPAAALLVCMVWMGILTIDRAEVEYRAWFTCWTIIAAAEAIYFPLYLVFTLPMLGLLFLGYLIKKRLRLAFGLLLVTVGAGAVAMGLMLLNYEVAGMFLQNPLAVFWKHADQAKFIRWYSPYLPLYLLEGSGAKTTGFSLRGFLSHNLEFWMNLFRVKSLGLLWLHPVVPLALAVLAAVVGFRRPAALPVRWKRIIPILIPLVVCIVIVDTSHPDSVYRNYCFLCFLLPVLLCGLWSAPFEVLLPKPIKGLLAAAFAFFVVCVSVSQALERAGARRPPDAPSRWSDFFGFAMGDLSVQDALIRGDGVWPVAQAARAVAGMDAQIYCFNFPTGNASFLFPGAGLLTEPTGTRLGTGYGLIAFGNAEAAIAALKKRQINYFLVDFSLLFRGAVPYGPLFDPDHLAERFDLAWAGGSACLFTWHGQGKERVPPEVVNAMRQRVQVNRKLPDPHPDGVWGRLADNMKAIYDYNQGKALPVRRPPDLPHVTGWQ